jgi:hypothetical protein
MMRAEWEVDITARFRIAAALRSAYSICVFSMRSVRCWIWGAVLALRDGLDQRKFVSYCLGEHI